MKLNQEKIAYLEENLGKNILPISMFENEVRPGNAPGEIIIFYKKETPIPKLRDSFFKAGEYYNLFPIRLIMMDDDKFALHHCTDGIEYKLLPLIGETFDNIKIDDTKK